MLPIVSTLLSQGLSLLGNAVLAKGQDVIEEKLGVSLEKASPMELRQLELEHEEYLLEIGIKEKELELQAEAAAAKEVTERWKADMSSDSWLSKNIRPLTLAFLTVSIVLLIMFKPDVKDSWISFLESCYMLVLGAYFVGRSTEKVVEMRGKWK